DDTLPGRRATTRSRPPCRRAEGAADAHTMPSMPPGELSALQPTRFSARASSVSFGEQTAYFLLRGLTEVDVVHPDGREVGGRAQADDLVRIVEPGQRIGRGDRHGRDHPPRTARSRHGAGRPHGGAGGDAVIYDDRHPAGDRLRRTPRTQRPQPALDLAT